MILTHGANSVKRGFNYGSVVIGGETYKTLNYNGTIWTVENIRNNIGTNYDTSPNGRLYSYSAFSSISSVLSDGWRLPTKDDFDRLVNFLGNQNPLDYVSKDFGGTNKNGFDVPLVGCFNYEGNRSGLNTTGYIWTTTDYPTISWTKYNFIVNSSKVGMLDYSGAQGGQTKLSVRLVKDV